MTPATLKFKLYDWNNAKKTLIPLRRSIFIKEQLVPEELEWDNLDSEATHVALLFNNDLIGCARLLFIDRIMRLERMAVIKPRRKQGFGTKLVYEIIQIAKKRNIKEIKISSQIQAMAFYQKIGFIEEGKIFIDAGIKHKKMKLIIK